MRLAPWICGGALAVATAAFGQTLSLGGSAPEGAPVIAPETHSKIPPVDPATVQGLASARDYKAPAGIVFRTSDFQSENVRLTAQWLYAAEAEGRKLPTVVMAAGRGATAAAFREDAVVLARAGYLVMLFDYRGWGESDGRITAKAGELRGYVDPAEQTEDWFNAVAYAATDPQVDAGRIGVLGSDLAGGHVIDVAAYDPRVKALVSLVTRADTRPYKPYEDPAKVVAEAAAQASRLAAGQGAYPAGGAPLLAKVARWAPVEAAARVNAPALFVLAQKEELFSNTNNGQQACERVQGPRRMMMLPKITHYGIYGPERARALNAAIDWFDRYLKPAGAATRVPIDRRQPERGECNPPPEPPKGEEKKDGSGEGHRAQDASGRWN